MGTERIVAKELLAAAGALIGHGDAPGAEQRVDRWVAETFAHAESWTPEMAEDGSVSGLVVAFPQGSLVIRPFCVGMY